jgi:hypothetical protein
VYMYVNGKVITFQTIPEMGEGDKKEWWKG